LPVTHTVANRREYPRILVLDDNEGFADRVNREGDLTGTVRVISDLSEVDQSEWDALFTTSEYLTERGGLHVARTYSRVAEHLYIFNVLPSKKFGNYGTLDRVKPLHQTGDPVTLRIQWEVAGHEVSVRSGLDRELRESIIQAVESRHSQSGLMNPSDVPEGVNLDSFAIGPRGLVLAGSLDMPGRGEVWFVPYEVNTLRPWITAALVNWRRRDSKKFPGIPEWWASPEWYSAAETTIAGKIADEEARFEEVKTKFEATLKELESELESAREVATSGARQLLSGQDDPLQEAIRDALEELGFTVRDMDLEWDEKERREDFRISDSDDPQWLVLGEATGVRGNAKGGKITALQGYVTKFVFEEKPENIPGQWYLLNREIEKDPYVRSTILREDEILPFAAEKGLILDTTALYVFLRHAIDQPGHKPAIRKYLRTSTGLLGLSDALQWIQDNPENG